MLSRSSVVQYKDSRRPLAQIARELGTARFVTGSVRRAGGRIRIVAQVVDARTEAHLTRATTGARSALEAVDQTHPRFALVQYFLTQCHAAEGRLDKALEHGRRAMEIADRSPETLAVHGYVLGRSARREEAEQAPQRLGALAEKR